MPRLVHRLLPALLAVLFAPLANATVVVPLELSALTQQSHAVVRGRVVGQHSFWGPAKERIYTHTRVAVSRSLKGRAKGVLTVRQWGGEADGVRMEVSGNARFKVGEDVVLFLTGDGTHHYVVALAQGKFSVQADASGQQVARRDLDGLTFARWSAQGKMSLSPFWELAAPMPLDTLLAEVKRALATPAGH